MDGVWRDDKSISCFASSLIRAEASIRDPAVNKAIFSTMSSVTATPSPSCNRRLGSVSARL